MFYGVGEQRKGTLGELGYRAKSAPSASSDDPELSLFLSLPLKATRPPKISLEGERSRWGGTLKPETLLLLPYPPSHPKPQQRPTATGHKASPSSSVPVVPCGLVGPLGG